MGRIYCFFIFFMFSCNRVETGKSLSAEDLKFIQQLNLIDKDENILRFYSEYRVKNAGNFFTKKRIAKYWIDDRDTSKNILAYAFYADIKSIDTFYKPGPSYCPYMLIKKVDGTEFKVCCDGSKETIESFFEDAMKLWNNGK